MPMQGHNDMDKKMFITVLFITVENWTQPRC